MSLIVNRDEAFGRFIDELEEQSKRKLTHEDVLTLRVGFDAGCNATEGRAYIAGLTQAQTAMRLAIGLVEPSNNEG